MRAPKKPITRWRDGDCDVESGMSLLRSVSVKNGHRTHARDGADDFVAGED